jgi:hypothetical protein
VGSHVRERGDSLECGVPGSSLAYYVPSSEQAMQTQLLIDKADVVVPLAASLTECMAAA